MLSSDREAAALETLRGPGIVDIAGRGETGELLLARAVCSLADVLHERGPLPEGEVRAVGAAAASALARVHDAGLVHGDIKPANLLLSGDGDLWLADFGGSAPADGAGLASCSAPRQAPGAPALPATDLRALAIVMVELSTGAVIDADVFWRATDLRLLGCPPALSADAAFMLGARNLLDAHQATPNAHTTAAILRHGAETLPAPAARARNIDPTPTVEFLPAAPQAPAATGSVQAAHQPVPRWWRRLAASWRSQPARAQRSKDSQASRSS